MKSHMIKLELASCLVVLIDLDVYPGDDRRSVEAASQCPSCVEPAVPVVRWCQLSYGLSSGAMAQACRVHDCFFLLSGFQCGCSSV